MFAKFLINVILPKKKKNIETAKSVIPTYRVSYVKDIIKYPSITIVRIPYTVISHKNERTIHRRKKILSIELWNID